MNWTDFRLSLFALTMLSLSFLGLGWQCGLRARREKRQPAGDGGVDVLAAIDETIRYLEKIVAVPSGGSNECPEHAFGRLHHLRKARAAIAARLAQPAGVLEPSSECWRKAIEESFLVRQFRPSLYWIEQRAKELAAAPAPEAT